MSEELIKELRQTERRIGQTEVIERPGVSGTWTPSFSGLTTAGVFTYAIQTGRWHRFGQIVYFEFDIAITAIPTPPTGNMVIGGLPTALPSGAAVQYGPVTFGFVSNINMPAGRTILTGLVPPGGFTRINLYTYAAGAGGATYPAASFVNVNCELIGGGWYEID